MNKELIELYIQAFKEGIFQKDNTGRIAPGYYTDKLTELIITKEWEVFTTSDVSWRRKDTSEYYAAEQQWRKIAMSKLYRSLK